jgi:protein TonB
MDGYKKQFAERVASVSPEFSEPVPEVLKSIVVLEVVIDRQGGLQRVAVRRSNGYKALEAHALESVRKAAPYAAPPFTIRRRDGTVSFLETFLFRDDGRYRILSLQQR